MSVSARLVYLTDPPQSFFVADDTFDPRRARDDLSIISDKLLEVLARKQPIERYRISEELRLVFDWVSDMETDKSVPVSDIRIASMRVSDGELQNCCFVWCSIAFLLKACDRKRFSPLEAAIEMKGRISSL